MKWLTAIGLLILGACNTSDDNSLGAMNSRQPEFNSNKTVRELIQVEGSSVSFGIRSFISIPCAGYEKQFPSAKPFSIINKEKLTAIDKHLQSLQPDSQNSEVDIRAKAILLYNDQTSDTLCIGKFNSYYKGEAVQVDEELISLLGINP